MGTQALIGLYEGGQLRTAVVNYDGYTKHIGKILLEKYKTVDAVRKIIDAGEIRAFQEDGSFTTYDDKAETAVYPPCSWEELYRDYFSVIVQREDVREYTYIFNAEDGKWYVGCGNARCLGELTQELIDMDY